MLDEFIHSRRKDKQITADISEAFYTTFITALEREDIEELSNALYKIPKTVEKFGERVLLAPQYVRGVDFSTQISLLERATDMVLEMIKTLRGGMDLETIKDLNDKLQYLESEADKHMMTLYKELFSGKHEPIQVIVLKDPDDIVIELVGEASDARWQSWPGSPVTEANQVRSFHSAALCLREEAPTAEFLVKVLGFREVGREAGRIRYATGEGGPHSILDLVVRPEAAIGEETTGTVHHIAWRALDDSHQLEWREVLVRAGREVTPVIERKYFRSIYSREPGGVLFEIATDQPGFTVDEPVGELGTGLRLPPQHEHKREGLDYNLAPIMVPTFAHPGTEA